MTCFCIRADRNCEKCRKEGLLKNDINDVVYSSERLKEEEIEKEDRDEKNSNL